jgi:hypothetical protein
MGDFEKFSSIAQEIADIFEKHHLRAKGILNVSTYPQRENEGQPHIHSKNLGAIKYLQAVGTGIMVYDAKFCFSSTRE